MVTLKNKQEILLMRKAGEITAGALEIAGRNITDGITTAELSAIIHNYILSKGAKPSFLGYGGFPASACISINEEVIHGIPSKRKIIDGDIISVDVGTIINGWNGDAARTFACGNISKEASGLLEATKLSLEKAIAVALPGNRLGDIAHAIQSTVEPLGYSVVRDYVGHGIGKDLHETPEVPNYGRAGHGLRLLPGMTLAIEPMINGGGFAVKVLGDKWTVVTADKSLSAHFENTIVITNKEPVILTSL